MTPHFKHRNSGLNKSDDLSPKTNTYPSDYIDKGDNEYINLKPEY